MANDRQQLRRTFESAARLYQQARPEYPAELFTELIRLAGLLPGDRLLEIGCATGKATAPLARRGFQITCVEIGPELAGLARQNLSGFAGVDVIQADFETWPAPPAFGFDLVYAATAWHWIDPAVRYRRAWDLLRAGGHLAFWSALHVPAGRRPVLPRAGLASHAVARRIGQSAPPQVRAASRSLAGCAADPDQPRTMSRIESRPATSLSSITIRCLKFPRTMADAACSRVHSGEAKTTSPVR